MKKLILFFVLVFAVGAAYSQNITITKGNEVPGKLTTTVAYENFVEGIIRAKDDKGIEYTFVKADFVLTNKSNAKISYKLTVPYFYGEHGEQGGEVARASYDGAVYTFSNIVVKDKDGKEYKIDKAVFEFAGFNH